MLCTEKSNATRKFERKSLQCNSKVILPSHTQHYMQDNVLFNEGGALGTIQFGEGEGVMWHLMEGG